MATKAGNGRARATHSRATAESGTAAPLRRQSTISRWGNSLGLRIPQEAADRLKLKAGAQVSIEVRGGAITIRPVRRRKRWSEAELLKGVNPAMVGGEIDWGGPVGREVG
jgi:antitoxin MazE